MSKSFKPRKSTTQRQPKEERSLIIKDMILTNKAESFRDRRKRRPKDAKNHWSKEWDS